MAVNKAEKICRELKWGQMNGVTSGIRCDSRGIDHRAACGKSFEAKRGEMELVSAHFRLYGSLCSIPLLHEAAFLSMLSLSFIWVIESARKCFSDSPKEEGFFFFWPEPGRIN